MEHSNVSSDQYSLSNRQKMDVILRQITENYGMSVSDFLWEYFQCSDSEGDIVERSPLHAASLEHTLQGQGAHTFGQILGEILKDPLSRPSNPGAQRLLFSAKESYLAIRPASAAITSLSMQLLREHSQNHVRDPVDLSPSQFPYLLSRVTSTSPRYLYKHVYTDAAFISPSITASTVLLLAYEVYISEGSLKNSYPPQVRVS